MRKIIYIILLMSVPVFAGFNPTWVKVGMLTTSVCHGHDYDFIVSANFQNLQGDNTLVTFKLAGMTKTDSVENLFENPETTKKILVTFDISEVEIGIYYLEASIGTAKLVTKLKDRKLTIFKVVIQPFDHVGAYYILAPPADKPKGLSNIRKVWVDILPVEAEVRVAFSCTSTTIVGKAICIRNGGGGPTGTLLTKSGFIEIEGYEASDVVDNVSVQAWNLGEGIRTCAEEKFTVVDCTKPFSLNHIKFVFADYEDPVGNENALDIHDGGGTTPTTKFKTDTNGIIQFVMPTEKTVAWDMEIFCNLSNLNTQADIDYYKKKNYTVGFVQNLLSAEIVYTYKDTDGKIVSKKLVKFPKALKDGSGEDPLFTDKLIEYGSGVPSPVSHGRWSDTPQPVKLKYADAPVMTAARFLYDNKTFTDFSIKESYISEAKIVLNFRTWIVVRHTSGCTRRLKNFDWKLDWHCKIGGRPPLITELPNIIKENMVIIADSIGNGDHTYIEDDGPLMNTQFEANVEFTKE